MSSADWDAGAHGVIKATRREWLGLAVLSLPCVMYSVDRTVMTLAVPRMSAELQPSSAQLLWIVDIYGFVLAGLLITMGTLGDRIGRRRLLLIGAGAFGVASVAAAISTSSGMLIASRALLGIGAAALAPSTLSLIRQMFVDSHERTVALGVWAMSYSVGGAIGPLLGGLLLEHFAWGSVFWIAVPAMLVLLAVGPTILPEYKSSTAGRMDPLSVLQSLVGVLLMIYGLKQLVAEGGGWSSASCMLLGSLVAISFVRRQSRLQNPLIDRGLFRKPAFTAALLAYSFAGFVVTGMSLFTGQYLQLVLGLSPLHAGLWTLPGITGLAIGSMLTLSTARRVSSAQSLSIGLSIAAVGLVIVAQMEHFQRIELLASGLLVFTFGLAPVFIRAIDMMVSSMPPQQAGEVSAISETGSELGAALGVALLGSIGTAVYRAAMESHLPHSLLPAVAQAMRDTLSTAFEAAQRLGDELREPLLDAARIAFDQSLQVVAMASAFIVVAVALVVAALTRLGRRAE